MIVGIVGSEAAKFTSITEEWARWQIRQLLLDSSAAVSGACHLSGIDAWAREEAAKLGIGFTEYPPASLRWSGGYKERNMQIAEASDIVYCITVRQLPPGYSGMSFKLCYHCGTDNHVKSGGCWTVKYARKIGKKGSIIIL